MKNFLLTTLCLIISVSIVHSNNFEFDSHKKYIEQVTQSHLLTYKDVLSKFDSYIELHPDDITSVIEKCNFIDAYLYAESDIVYFDSLEQDAEDCESQIFSFPEENPERIMYKLYSKWNEDALEVFHEAEFHSLYDWSIENKTRIYTMMDTKFKWQNPRTYEYANRGFNETKNLRFAIGAANYQLEIGNKNQAIEIIKNFKADSFENRVELIELYLKLDLIDEASNTFDLIKSKDGIQDDLLFKLKTSINHRYLPTNEELETIQNLWNFEDVFKELYGHAIQQKNYVVAHSIYNYRSSKDFWFDPFKYIKFKLYKQTNKWDSDIQDFYATLMWLSLIVISFLVMFAIIAPIHYRGLYRRVHKKKELVSLSQWNLKHALYLGAIFLLLDFVLALIFQYQYFYSSFFSDTETEILTTEGLNSKIYFYKHFIFLLFSVLIFKQGIKLFKIDPVEIFKSIFIAAGIFLAFKIIVVSSLFFVKLTEISTAVSQIKIIIDDINTTHGALTVFFGIAVLTPIIEEFLFRGVFLNSFTKHISFGWANTIQSALFALVHENMNMFLYYFAFGFITGVMVKKQKHLYGAIAFHAINNALAVAAMVL